MATYFSTVIHYTRTFKSEMANSCVEIRDNDNVQPLTEVQRLLPALISDLTRNNDFSNCNKTKICLR